MIPFDAEFAAREASAFIDDVLVGALGAVHVSVGENFRFGHRAQGNAALLQADLRFTTTVHPLLEIDGEIVSSSHIRGLLAAGEVQAATRLLGAPFLLAARSSMATSVAASSASRPPTSCPRSGLPAPGMASTPAAPASAWLPSASACVRPSRPAGRS